MAWFHSIKSLTKTLLSPQDVTELKTKDANLPDNKNNLKQQLPQICKPNAQDCGLQNHHETKPAESWKLIWGVV